MTVKRNQSNHLKDFSTYLNIDFVHLTNPILFISCQGRSGLPGPKGDGGVKGQKGDGAQGVSSLVLYLFNLRVYSNLTIYIC